MLEEKLNELENIGYDAASLKKSFEVQIEAVKYQFEKSQEKGKDVVIVPNNIRDIVEGDIIFVNLGIGYAHEIMKPHWCYVLKDCKSKFVVIPIHTVRGVICDEHEIDIQTVIEGSITTSRMSLSDIRSIDKQRIDQRRSVGKVLTPRSEILESIRKYFNL